MTVTFDRLFSASAFEAARTVRHYRRRHPSLQKDELLKLVRAMTPDSYDFEAGFELNDALEEAADFSTASSFYRHCIERLVSRNQIWLRIIALGRKKFVQKLSPDEQNCFAFAGLLHDPPDDATVSWWDHTASELRQLNDLEVMRRARSAEQLSLQHEKHRLRSLGLDLSPIWTGFDDNTVGYDILSYDPAQPNPINRLIEVKSTISSPLRFFISRNEWETAMKFGNRYFFHIWDLREPRLYERNVSEILPKVPTDNENGRWKNALIPI